ncbi:MAG: DUF7059 domain-containing protein, partial [Nocardioides sp.]
MEDREMARRLRDAVGAAGFTVDAVAELLGTDAHAALSRNETTPAMRRTSGGSPLETLIRLFLLQVPVPANAADTALPGLVDPMAACDLLTRSIDTSETVVAKADVRPYSDENRDLWAISDLTPGLDGRPFRIGPDYVLGISPASTSLAQLTIRDEIAHALDLGTGCGVQALHLATHCDAVTATDVNPRALWMTRLNLALNDCDWVEVREGSYFEPVARKRFDLIVTNPPFVISPATGERLVYRDSGLPGDRVVENIVRAAPQHLTEGGRCQILANWAIVGSQPWNERLAEWIDVECDAYVVQRERMDIAEYVELWLKDGGQHGGPDYAPRYDAWLSWLESKGIAEVGFGWINLRRTLSEAPIRDFRDWPHAVERPVAPAIGRWAAGAELARRLGDDELSATRLVRRDDVMSETQGLPGAEHPATIVLRQMRGLMLARQVDTV